jgi:hypothetical protein
MSEIATTDEIDKFVSLCVNVMRKLVKTNDFIVDALTEDRTDSRIFRFYDDLDLPDRLAKLYDCEWNMLGDLKAHAETHADSVEREFLARCRNFVTGVDEFARNAKKNLPTSIQRDVYVLHRAYLRELVLHHWTVLDIATGGYADIPGVGTRIGDLRTALEGLKEFRSVFISYASQDRDVVTTIRGHVEKFLEARHVFLWTYEKQSDSCEVLGVADSGIEGTAIWKAELARRMSLFDLALVLTSESYVKSGPCVYELDTILAARDDRALRMLPIRLSKCKLEDDAKIMGTEWFPKGDQRFRDLAPGTVEDLCVRTLAPSLVRVVTLLADRNAVGKFLRDLKWLEEQPDSSAAATA